jgi:hypothetical protein
MTVRKAPKMHWLKKMVKKITCWMIALNIFTLMCVSNFAIDIATQAITQEYDLMDKKNKTTIDFNMDPNQFWMNKQQADIPAFQPFEFDDAMDFDIDFETNEKETKDLLKAFGAFNQTMTKGFNKVMKNVDLDNIKEEDVFKMLENFNESISNIKEEDIDNMLDNLNETINKELVPYFNTTVQPVFGRGDHDQKHHWKHHQKHPKNMMKKGFTYDMHKVSKEELLQKVRMVVPAIISFVMFFMVCGILFW